jgi:hypothetical protein
MLLKELHHTIVDLDTTPAFLQLTKANNVAF